MLLTTVENVKNYLGVNNTVDDALFSRLVEAASGFVTTYVSKQFEVVEYTDKFDGNNQAVWVTRHHPLRSVVSVVIDGQAVPAAATARDAGYRFNAIKIVLDAYRFHKGVLNCEVVYQAGYDAVPAEIEQATIEIIAHRYKEKDRIGLQSKGLAGESIVFSQRDMPNSARTVLERYQRVIPS